MPIIVKANRVPNWLRQFSHPEPQKRFIVFYFSPVCLFLCNPCHLIYIGLQVHILSNITKLLLNFSSLKSYWCPKAPGLTNLHLMIRSASSCYCIRIHTSFKGYVYSGCNLWLIIDYDCGENNTNINFTGSNLQLQFTRAVYHPEDKLL